jgi:hypothetical protein
MRPQFDHYTVCGLKTSRIVGAINIVHPTTTIACSDHAAEFFLLQRDGLPNVLCTVILNRKNVSIVAHLDATCLCNISFNVTSECSLTNTASIVGVIYRRIICKLDPISTMKADDQPTFVDLSWTPVKLTHFAICLAFQTYGVSETDTAIGVPTTQWGPSSWTFSPSDVKLEYEYKRTHFMLNQKKVPYPPGVSIREESWDVTNASKLAPLATDIWKCTVTALWP